MTTMHHRLVAAVALLTCLAAYCLAYQSRRISPDLLEKLLARRRQNAGVTVECPVCPWDADCERSFEGRLVKVCRHGTFANPACNGREDCLKAPGEFCDEVGQIFCEKSLRCVNFHCEGVSASGKVYYGLELQKDILSMARLQPLSNRSDVYNLRV